MAAIQSWAPFSHRGVAEHSSVDFAFDFLPEGNQALEQMNEGDSAMTNKWYIFLFFLLSFFMNFPVEAQAGSEVRGEMFRAWSNPRQGATVIEPSTGMEFVWVPGGTYEMGCGSWSSEHCYGDAMPVHQVVLKGFWVGKCEVTQGQWQGLMGSNPSDFSSCGADCPVERVSWEDVQGFIRKLNGRVDGPFRLLTEAEWEYACRSGGKEEKYCGGANADMVAWHSGNSGRKTHPVGKKLPNGLGLYDMSGNVFEWVSDWYSDNYYVNSPRDNPQGPSSGSARVVRGSGWHYGPAFVRSAARYGGLPSNRRNSLGFRLARTSP